MANANTKKKMLKSLKNVKTTSLVLISYNKSTLASQSEKGFKWRFKFQFNATAIYRVNDLYNAEADKRVDVPRTTKENKKTIP